MEKPPPQFPWHMAWLYADDVYSWWISIHKDSVRPLWGSSKSPGIFNALVNPSADLRQWIRDTGREGLDLLPGDRSTATAQIVINAENRPVDAIADLFKPYAPDYDYIIFDTAPSVGGIQERAIFASDRVLIPTATEFLSMDGLSQIMDNDRVSPKHT